MTSEEAATRPYAEVIIDISHERVDHPFTYEIPEEMRGVILPGMQVEIPFGRGNTVRKGYVIALDRTSKYSGSGAVKKLIGPARGAAHGTEADAVALALWMKNRYGSTAITALKTVLPNLKDVKPVTKRTVVLTAGEKEAEEKAAFYEKKHQVARLRLLESLMENPEQPYELITEKLHVTAQTIRSLEKAGLLRVDSESHLRNPVTDVRREEDTLVLSREQQNIVDSILADADRGGSVSLIHGITGSGKTEVYIKIIEGIVARGRQAIMLIPEIALTYQTLIRFYRHFGDRVSVMNSTLSAGEKADQFERARRGEIDVIIGPRSALFTPFPDPGVIVIDEEHENSYKNENMPKYHTREVAIEIAKMHKASVVLGSATPSLESYYRSETGEYKRYELTKRLTGGQLPHVSVCDMREELRNGNRSIFSEQLQSLIEDRLREKEQIMLFLNRRGIAGFVSCRACGTVMKCPHCDISLSLHRNGMLVCHYCGYSIPMPKTCPECGSPYIAGFRAGTEQVEESIRKMYPEARVLRMDADTTARKGAYERILSAFANEEADILIGTQMIVKGHDFPKVTLVGILLADLSLGVGDYRASERTFQLLTQAAGRAGRGPRPGEVVIQTYEPDNYAIVHASKQDYRGFYEEEIGYRTMMCYPPVFHMLAVEIQDKDENTALQMAGDIRELLGKESGNCVIIGPAAASIGRIRDYYRYAVYIKDRNYDTLVRYKDRAEEWLKARTDADPRYSGTIVQFDFDPVNPF